MSLKGRTKISVVTWRQATHYRFYRRTCQDHPITLGSWAGGPTRAPAKPECPRNGAFQLVRSNFDELYTGEGQVILINTTGGLPFRLLWEEISHRSRERFSYFIPNLQLVGYTRLGCFWEACQGNIPNSDHVARRQEISPFPPLDRHYSVWTQQASYTGSAYVLVFKEQWGITIYQLRGGKAPHEHGWTWEALLGWLRYLYIVWRLSEVVGWSLSKAWETVGGPSKMTWKQLKHGDKDMVGSRYLS